MRHTSVLLLVLLMSGCAFAPPKPKQCQGEFRPVNVDPAKEAASLTFEQNLAICQKGGVNVTRG